MASCRRPYDGTTKKIWLNGWEEAPAMQIQTISKNTLYGLRIGAGANETQLGSIFG